MPPPRASSADNSSVQTAPQIAAQIEAYLAEHPEAAVLEDGKVAFDLRSAKLSISTDHNRCTMHLWSEERNLVRQIVSVTTRGDALRLTSQRFGQTQTKLIELVSSRDRRTPTTAETARRRFLPLLERTLNQQFAGWTCEGFRSSIDLERSFGPAYARGVLVRGNVAWAVIGVNEQETATTIDGVLTPGILWLHYCREKAGGRRLFQGLRVIVPRGTIWLTLSRLAWLNNDAAQWELWDLHQSSEELTQHEPADQGNLRTRLIHHPDEAAARDRFADATAQVMQLVPPGQQERVDLHLRSTAELAFLLHGLEFARARIEFAPNSFAQKLQVTVGAGGNETLLTNHNRLALAETVAELFARRRATGLHVGTVGRQARIIGAPSTSPAHARLQRRLRPGDSGHLHDPLYRAAPERWLESMLRRDLSPLTRNLAPPPDGDARPLKRRFANEQDPDSIGNRAEAQDSPELEGNRPAAADAESRIIPRLDPQHVYAQVPAIAGASDRGLLDLLGITADGRLAVIELKVEEDLHFALQGLDYWIRVRHHHLQKPEAGTGLGELQRHGYFHGVQLSPLPPRLYLVAPSLHIHPATETILRYFSSKVEWNLLALDERWPQQIRVVWRKQNTP